MQSSSIEPVVLRNFVNTRLSLYLSCVYSSMIAGRGYASGYICYVLLFDVQKCIYYVTCHDWRHLHSSRLSVVT